MSAEPLCQGCVKAARKLHEGYSCGAHPALSELMVSVRDAALEEAARIVETDTYPRDRGEYPARLIRARKRMPPKED
jgi:hypothetical protein